jgi:hypothetical protein
MDLAKNSTLFKKAKAICKIPPKSQLVALQKSIELLAHYSTPSPIPTQLSGQPFDYQLLNLSALYRKSRRTYRTAGGTYSATLLSSGRTLSSASLLKNHIEYSPLEQEMTWIATDPLEKKKPNHLIQLRTYATSVFHEQNHRILWGFLPSAPIQAVELRMYLNFAESLVVAADMALGDELGYVLAQLFYNVGVIYHPGTSAPQDLGSSRKYRNYLHAAVYATYLNLELFDFDEIRQAVYHLYPNVGEYTESVLKRSLQLDRKFVEKTNPFWQHRNSKKVKAVQRQTDKIETLQLPENPLDNRLIYLWSEKWMDKLGLGI